MNDPIEVITGIMELEALRDEWDQPPALCVIIHDRGNYMVHDLQVPQLIWAAAVDPKRAVAGIGSVIERMGMPVQLGHLRGKATQLAGVVMFTEGWALMSKGPEDAAAAIEYAENHRISDHPDRVEVKIAAGTVDGERFAIRFNRGSGVQQDGKGTELEGAMHEVLDKFLEQLLGAAA